MINNIFIVFHRFMVLYWGRPRWWDFKHTPNFLDFTTNFCKLLYCFYTTFRLLKRYQNSRLSHANHGNFLCGYRFNSLFRTIVILVLMLSLPSQRNWCVTGPKNWTGTCKSGKKQSPINIKMFDTKYEKMTDFTLTNYDRPSYLNFTATNNGKIGTVVFKVPPNIYNVSGGGLEGVFTTVQFHFHWGSNDSIGSEHILDGKAFAAEVRK